MRLINQWLLNSFASLAVNEATVTPRASRRPLAELKIYKSGDWTCTCKCLKKAELWSFDGFMIIVGKDKLLNNQQCIIKGAALAAAPSSFLYVTQTYFIVYFHQIYLYQISDHSKACFVGVMREKVTMCKLLLRKHALKITFHFWVNTECVS